MRRGPRRSTSLAQVRAADRQCHRLQVSGINAHRHGGNRYAHAWLAPVAYPSFAAPLSRRDRPMTKSALLLAVLAEAACPTVIVRIWQDIAGSSGLPALRSGDG